MSVTPRAGSLMESGDAISVVAFWSTRIWALSAHAVLFGHHVRDTVGYGRDETIPVHGGNGLVPGGPLGAGQGDLVPEPVRAGHGERRGVAYGVEDQAVHRDG